MCGGSGIGSIADPIGQAFGNKVTGIASIANNPTSLFVKGGSELLDPIGYNFGNEVTSAESVADNPTQIGPFASLFGNSPPTVAPATTTTNPILYQSAQPTNNLQNFNPSVLNGLNLSQYGQAGGPQGINLMSPSQSNTPIPSSIVPIVNNPGGST